ncbi:unnamed protein product, partial [Polarella glacialis]
VHGLPGGNRYYNRAPVAAARLLGRGSPEDHRRRSRQCQGTHHEGGSTGKGVEFPRGLARSPPDGLQPGRSKRCDLRALLHPLGHGEILAHAPRAVAERVAGRGERRGDGAASERG